MILVHPARLADFLAVHRPTMKMNNTFLYKPETVRKWETDIEPRPYSPDLSYIRSKRNDNKHK